MALDGNQNITINWPCDCGLQSSVWKTMLTDIEAQDTYIDSKKRKQLQIFADNQPSTAQWQTQWILQGNSLPITTGVECLWFDTSANTYGAQYYVVGGIPYPVEMLKYRGIHTEVVAPISIFPYATNLAAGAGIARWDNAGGKAVTWDWIIPENLLGKNYHVKFHVPMMFLAAYTAFWTIWYENTNLYNTLFGGAGELGFGTWAATPASPLSTFVEWTQEIPAGGSYPRISIRVGSTSGVWQMLNYPPYDGGSNTAYGYGWGSATAEFILKTE